jgi:hypothetical protein
MCAGSGVQADEVMDINLTLRLKLISASGNSPEQNML